jgi:hypothetical protein
VNTVLQIPGKFLSRYTTGDFQIRFHDYEVSLISHSKNLKLVASRLMALRSGR